MNNEKALIMMYAALPEELQSTFIDMCNDNDKAILNEYVDNLKQGFVLEKEDKVTPIDEQEIYEMNKVGFLCERCLDDVNIFSYCLREYEISYNNLDKLSTSLEQKQDNPVIKEMKDLVDKVKDSIAVDKGIREGFQEVKDAYEVYKKDLSNIPFGENKAEYIEAGASIFVEKWDSKNIDKVVSVFAFPLYLAEPYRDNDKIHYRSNEVRSGYLYPLDKCSKNDYLEINSKVNLNFDKEKIDELETLLDVNKYDKIKYELEVKELKENDNKDKIAKDAELFNKEFEDKKNNDTANDSVSKNIENLKNSDKSETKEAKGSKYDKYGDWDEIKKEYEELQDVYDAYCDSSDSCE